MRLKQNSRKLQKTPGKLQGNSSKILKALQHMQYPSCKFLTAKVLKLARSVGVPVGWHSGGQLATTLVATINNIISPFFLVVYFSHRRSAPIKKLI